IVEDEVVGVFQQWHFSEYVAAEGAVASVVFRELHSQEKILKRGEHAVGYVFVKRHTAAQRGATDNARAQHNVIYAVRNHAGEGGDQQRRVRIIRVQHDDDIGARGQGFAVAGLLVTAIAVVAVVLENVQAQLVRKVNGAVRAVVIDQDADVHQFRHFSHRSRNRLLRVVGRHHDRDAFTVNHS